MAFIESHQQLERHPKVSALASEMAWDLDQTIGKLHRLWWWCLEYASDGQLGKYNDAQLAMAMGVAIADSRKLVEALVQARWLDREPTFRVHNWPKYTRRYLRDYKFRDDEPKFRAMLEAYGFAESAPSIPPTIPPSNLPSNPPSARQKVGSVLGVPNLTIPNLTIPNPSLAEEDQKRTTAVELPVGFPKSEDDSVTAASIHCSEVPPDEIRRFWLEAASVGGRDIHDRPIQNWVMHVKARWKHPTRINGAAKANAPTGQPNGAQLMVWQKQLDGVEKELLNTRPEGLRELSEQEKDKRRKLKSLRDDLKSKLGLTV